MTLTQHASHDYRSNAAPDGGEVMRRLDELARFSSDQGALTRLFLTAEHRQAIGQVEAWMQEAGLATHVDDIGNLVGRSAGASGDLPTLLLGSHIDTVRNAGKYDGNLGVVAAIQAVRRLRAEGIELPFAIEVLAFGDEEGVRFPATLNGSRAVAGRFDPAVLEVCDSDGVSLRRALTQFGLDPAGIPSIRRDPAGILGYVEVHIEQGPVLEERDLPVGVVTAISGASRFTITIDGVAGHAGTVPMNLRRDACAAAAEMILAVERVASMRRDVVATVGRIAIAPSAVNVIASRAEFSLDLRSPSDEARHAAVRDLKRAFEAIAAYRNVTSTIVAFYEEDAAVCSPAIVAALEKSVASQGVMPLRLPSGAGHDGLAIANLCPFGMLFMRCAGGISHNPAEAVEAADVQMAVDVLVDFLRTASPETFRT